MPHISSNSWHNLNRKWCAVCHFLKIICILAKCTWTVTADNKHVSLHLKWIADSHQQTWHSCAEWILFTKFTLATYRISVAKSNQSGISPDLYPQISPKPWSDLEQNYCAYIISGFLPKASKVRGNGGAFPRNAETAGAKVSFRPRNNLPSLSAGWQSISLYSWLPGLTAGLQESSPEEPNYRPPSPRTLPPAQSLRASSFGPRLAPTMWISFSPPHCWFHSDATVFYDLS